MESSSNRNYKMIMPFNYGLESNPYYQQQTQQQYYQQQDQFNPYYQQQMQQEYNQILTQLQQQQQMLEQELNNQQTQENTSQVEKRSESEVETKQTSQQTKQREQFNPAKINQQSKEYFVKKDTPDQVAKRPNFKLPNPTKGNIGRNQKRVSDRNADPLGNVRNMEKYSIRLLKDIGYGNVDIFNIPNDPFNNPQFLQVAIRVIANLQKRAMIIKTSLDVAYINTPNPDPMVREIYQEQVDKLEAYTFIWDRLCEYRDTKDSNALTILASRLPRYRYDI